MGTRVLDAGPIEPGLHIYAHCQRNASNGGVTLLAINLEDSAATINVPGPAEVYAMTAPELQSKTVLLNDQPLELGPDDSLPEISPEQVKGNGVELAPTSVNFVVIPEANNSNCQS